MAGQNQSSSVSRRRSSTTFITFVRGTFFLLIALIVSFAIGFFVFAKIVPLGPSEHTDGSDSTTNSTGPGKAAAGVKPGASPERNPAHAGDPPVNTPKNDGPTLLAEDGIQKPDKLDAGHTKKPTADPDANSPPTPTTSGLNPVPQPSTGGDGADTAARTEHPAGTVQLPGSPDNPTAVAETPKPAIQPKTGLYRVQIGVFSTKDKAEEVAASAKDKGFAVTVREVNKDGRILYRVQHSSHRDRARAEAEQQKLMDAGIEATIINPT